MLHLYAESSHYVAEIASKSMIYIAFLGSNLGMKICKRCEVVLQVGDAHYERLLPVAAIASQAQVAIIQAD